MKSYMTKYLFTVAFWGFLLLGTSISTANDFCDHGYVDFSSDRSTWFFRIDGGTNDTVFFDFFFPFDPTRRIKIYDPLIKFELDNPYYLTPDNVLMVGLGDLKKLYAPYFDFHFKDNTLVIQHTVYDKLLLSGAGARATSLEYTKKVWSLSIDTESKISGVLGYTEYEPALGGRNKPVSFNDNTKTSFKDKQIIFKHEAIQIDNGNYFISLAEIMRQMGKVVFENRGYLHVQSKDMADVTVGIDRTDTETSRKKITAPDAGNTWHGGTTYTADRDYAWADYMNDVADGKRKTGWLWDSFFIPSGGNFVDADGKKAILKADRIIPYNIYVPSAYDTDTTKLVFMLHGGTGNENTATYRIMNRNMPIDQYAETFNYILVSPNGWTQNPMWREGQALYSFRKAAESALKKYPVNKNKVFITGNSMGGKGTLEIAMRHPEMFRAMAPTAMKITDRDRASNTKTINFQGTAYCLDGISEMPAFIVQGTADTVTSYKTQIGSKTKPGSIVSAVMPKLKNALYLAVEGGDHSYSFGSLLIPMFDFFDSTLNPYKDNYNFDTLYLSGKNSTAHLDDGEFKLSAMELKDNTVMLPLCDLEKIYGESFKVYPVTFHHKTPEKSVSYYTVTYNKTSLNFHMGTTIYRKNIQRYKEDGNVRARNPGASSEKKAADMEVLDPAPRFSRVPYEKSGKIFVPVQEFMAEFGREVTIK